MIQREPSSTSTARFPITGRGWLYIALVVALILQTTIRAAECLDVFSSNLQTVPPGLDLPTFEYSASSTDLSGAALSVTAGEYRNITITQNGTANFTSANSIYRVNQLIVAKNASLTLAPGDYFIDTLVLELGATISLTNTGTVRLYINTLIAGKNASLAVGNTYLVVVAYNQVTLEQGVDFNGAMYVSGDFSVAKNAILTGAINVTGNATTDSKAQLNYDPGYISNADFNGMCGTATVIDHIELSTDGDALTCDSETLTIRACADASCTAVANGDVTVTLGITGNAFLDINPVTIPADSIAGIQLSLTDRTAETVTLSLSSATPLPTNGLICSNLSCEVIFNEAGYLLSLPNHAACSAQNLTIQAVKLADNGISCAPAYTGSQTINVAFNYQNPASGTIIPVLDGQPMAAAGVDQARTVTFDANAQTSLGFSYNDAGQLDIQISDAGLNGLSAATINTTIRPEKLLIYTADPASDCPGPDFGACSAFRSAGISGSSSSTFSLTVAGACADDSITGNFQMTAINLAPTLVAPATGSNATLATTSVDITTNGQAIVPQALSEVGVFSIIATPGSYFGETIAPTTSANIGRFTPHGFQITDNNPMLDDATCDFTYQGQETGFAPGLAPELTVTAVNSAGATTLNYGGNGVANNDFWKLDAIDYSDRTYNSLATPWAGSLTSVLGAAATSGAADYDGVHLITLNADTVTHNKASVAPQPGNDAPFDAQLTLTVTAASLTDTDGISYDPDSDGTADNYVSSTIDGTNVRWGRWYLENGFGSELQTIVMPGRAEFFTGSQFVTAGTDNCSTAPTTTLSNYSGNLNVGETIVSQSPISSGLINFNLSAPGTGNTGSVLLTLTTPSWLQYDYDGDGTADNARATATFGIYEGRRPVIIKRQTY